jgi:beta-mannosidase
MGTIYWQMNDCWPAPTWSSIDYQGNWKALHYAMRDDYQPVAILQKTTDKGEVQLYVKSDVMENQVLGCKIFLYNLNWGERGLSPLQVVGDASLGYQESKLIWSVIPKNEQLIRVELSNGITRDFLVGPAPKKRLVQIELKLENIDKINKKADILVKNSAFCADFWLFSAKSGISFDRNFVHLLPGEHKIKITYSDEIPEIKDFNYLYR